MAVGEASGLLVHEDLIADGSDIWAAPLNEEVVVEKALIESSTQ